MNQLRRFLNTIETTSDPDQKLIVIEHMFTFFIQSEKKEEKKVLLAILPHMITSSRRHEDLLHKLKFYSQRLNGPSYCNQTFCSLQSNEKFCNKHSILLDYLNNIFGVNEISQQILMMTHTI